MQFKNICVLALASSVAAQSSVLSSPTSFASGTPSITNPVADLISSYIASKTSTTKKTSISSVTSLKTTAISTSTSTKTSTTSTKTSSKTSTGDAAYQTSAVVIGVLFGGAALIANL